MLKTWPTRLGLALIVLALGGLLVWLDPGGLQTVPTDPDARAEEPGHVLHDAELTLFDEQGNIQQGLTTPRLVHTPQSASTLAETPHATLYDSERRVWNATSEIGTLNTRSQELTLSGDARLIAPEEGWQLDTDVLHYEGKTAHAWSDTHVLLQQPPQRMTARRMDAWLNEEEVRLEGDVQGHHPPETQPGQE
ncbi:LPS export ABC transporter periplasmic protein LptC [Halomonas sp. G11]|jgi:lipopolysaccharide export system protein LptC|uniref:LPS export ABC transporter periplasmic protein LptC n=1 Tax=Halomonas sp. G11 TaxID=1684425 RepID=UPI0007FEA575|nr:LPS export ABC transporter periplasmic protein LptC [Halomonas sp. G11]OAZ92582.1 LPS export ABC transporter periplasmic protein LptC [Halomonas sp. G11]